MKYNDMIEKIMPLVNEGSNLPFILWHNNGDWNIDYLNISKDKAAAYIAGIKAHDPCAIQFTGQEFSRASFPMVFDKVFTARLWLEAKAAAINDKANDTLEKIADFVEDHIGCFSFKTLEYLTSLGKPLEVIESYITGGFTDWNEYGAELLDKLILDEAVAGVAFDSNDVTAERERTTLQEIKMDDAEATARIKHNINGYKELNSIQLAGCVVILAENLNAENTYMVANYRRENPNHNSDYYELFVTSDYIEAVTAFIMRQDELLTQLKMEYLIIGQPVHTLTDDDCIPHALDGDITGKLIVIKPDVLASEYRRSEFQLKICDGGNGARPNAQGSAIFCTDLYSGRECRFERHDVAGVADLIKIPEWATKAMQSVFQHKEPEVAAVELKNKLEKVAAFIIEKSARETTSGNYYTGADDIPADLISPELFEENIEVIAAMMEEYGAVQEVGVTSSGEIDVMIFSDYCPNYETTLNEPDFPPDRKTLDPLITRHIPGEANQQETLEQSPVEVYLVNNKTSESVWLSLPSDAERLRETLHGIGVTDEDYSVGKIKSLRDSVETLAASNSGIDELNMLAHWMTDLHDWAVDKLDAIIKSGLIDVKDTAGLINLLYEDNMSCFDLINVSNANELGWYWQNEDPDVIEDGMTPEEYGKLCANDEKSVFTEHGYLYQRFEINAAMYTGIVPDEYRITESVTKINTMALPKTQNKTKKSVIAALDKGKEKVAQADAARKEQGKKTPSRRRGGQEQGD